MVFAILMVIRISMAAWMQSERARELLATALVVDDEWGIRDIVKLALAHIGIVVIEAESAQTALALLAQTEADVVITDILLPDMNGLDLVQQIHQWRSSLPTIFMSAATSALFLAQDQAQEICLEKPFKIQELQRVVQEVLAWPRPETESVP